MCSPIAVKVCDASKGLLWLDPKNVLDKVTSLQKCVLLRKVDLCVKSKYLRKCKYLSSNLVAALASLDVHDFSHVEVCSVCGDLLILSGLVTSLACQIWLGQMLL